MTRITSLLLFCCCTLSICAQQGTPGSTDRESGRFALIEAAQRELLDSIYIAVTGNEHAYINGDEYFLYHFRAKNKPLLYYGEDRTSEIVVGGRRFSGLVLQYDTFTDEVIFSEIDNGFGNSRYNISIKPDHSGSFALFFRTDTLRFRYLTTADTGGEIPEGFYEIAYEGPTSYIIRHRSVVHQRNGIDEYFYSPVSYIRTPDGYRKITSGRKFLKLFGEGAAEIKRIADQRRIKPGKATKKQIKYMIQTYDSRRGATREL